LSFISFPATQKETDKRITAEKFFQKAPDHLKTESAKKLWKDAIWKEYEWNTSATFTLIASICAIICFTIMMVFFHPTMLAIFVPKVFAAVKLLALVGIYV